MTVVAKPMRHFWGSASEPMPGDVTADNRDSQDFDTGAVWGLESTLPTTSLSLNFSHDVINKICTKY